MIDWDQEGDILITSTEAVPGVEVRILSTRTTSKFQKRGLEIGNVGFIKTVPGNPWESSSDLIWVTKDGKEGSKSFGFRPEELERVKPDSE